MNTTLYYFCQALGWQGGTIHQAKERFAVASISEMDRVCNVLVSNMSDISDLETAQYFTQKRLEAIRLHKVTL